MLVGGARDPGNLVDTFMRGGKMGASGATSSSAGRRASSTRVPVYLNVYDLTPMNGYVYWFGLGIFHSGIEAHGLEYGFGAHDYPSSGVFEVEPRNCPGFTFRRSIVMGTTDMTPHKFRSFIEECADDYRGNSYHLISKNCNHFTNDVCMRLTAREIPGWVNRLAGIGSFCNCLLPESLQVAVVNQTERIESSERFESPKQEVTRRSLASLFGSESNGSKTSEGESSMLLLAQPDGDAKALRRERR